MLDIATFHERLADFSARAIIAANEAVRPSGGGVFSQGNLFEDECLSPSLMPSDKNTKAKDETTKPSEEKPKREVKPLVRKVLKWEDYKKIFCGNIAAASYWYNRDNGVRA